MINIFTIELPGHGKRMAEPLLTTMPELAEDVFQQIKDRLNRPYALYGHSMGAILGYLVAQTIVHAHLSLPVHLFVSGHPGPSIPIKEEIWHLLPRDEFIKKVMQYGGIPEEVAREDTLMDLFVPIMRADFQAIETYHYENVRPVDIPVTVMIGSDEAITHDEALRWQAVTNRNVTVKQFPGGHFFIFDHWPAIGQLISETLKNTD